ncbi:carbohydrate sulfotransferase 11-like isoform X1 [Homarus americanus]|uniref:Carbohydrate sulfotransferase n=1 Tax=Homarus americanus TaxID=6706 RepID=A0A8J5MLL2_HOMAM|nr:carbohydrate sulfotransferase 11-like isoform X1 [Homarus americanus]XP_042204804.1 carbohydrate sulfotransferase 11-like isoform X1 [Homarus americanus]XP_042204805.1 carbohydrate sulfotransferase 11-like isoform X1 [Homarus americanus]KAG7155929.1 Carbohydrate sulfotransferase 11-like 8 [Homarus americanus]
MMCRLRAVVWALVGLTLFTCIASVRWFILSATLADKMPLSSNIPASEETLSLSHVTLEMKHRKKAVERACSVDVWPNTFDNGLPSVGDPITEELVTNPKMLNNLIVDDKNHILYCYVPKVACTNWKRIMLMLMGGTNLTEPHSIPSDSVHRKNVFTKLGDLEPQDIRYRLHTYTKFIFVRHPIERVLSAFRNKFEKNYTSSAYFKKRFGVKIIKKYRKGIDPADIPASGHGVKFSEFVSYLIDTKTDQLNEHWAPVSTMCYPCSVRYDYVGKYETLAEDSEYILREVGAPPSIQFPEVIPSKTTAYVDPYFDTLSKNQQQDLIRIYEDDFRVFDYHFRNLI